MQARLNTLWAAAVAAMKTCIDAGFSETDNTAALLVLKDYTYLTACALARHRFDTAPILVRRPHATPACTPVTAHL